MTQLASSEAYTSLFTGDELDYAVAKALGNKYRGNVTPGCHLIGDTIEMAIDLDALLIPGKYTVYFYINGPEALKTNVDIDPIREFSVRPIYLQIYTTGGDHLYQTIMVNALLFYRDMWSGEADPTGHIPWKQIDLGVEGTVITNNLEFSESGTEEALSQRMGTVLVDAMRKLQIGNANLLDFTNGFYLYGDNDPTNDTDEINAHWNCTHGEIELVTYDDISDGNVDTPLDTTLTINKFPMFDDIDGDIIALFKSTDTYAVFESDKTNNFIYVSSNSKYTASVYLVYDSKFLALADSAEAFISIKNGLNEVRTRRIQLNLLGAPSDYPQGEIPDNLYCYNKTLYGTDYDVDPNVEHPDWADSYTGQFKTIEKAASELGYYRLSVTIDPGDLQVASRQSLTIQFGFSGAGAKGIMVLPKVEYGEYATQYNHSWGDLYYYFTNCEEFFGVPIDITSPTEFQDQDSFVYVPETEVDGVVIPAHFNAEPVAVGGGGGFIVHADDDLTITDYEHQSARYSSSDDNQLDRLFVSYSPTYDPNAIITDNDQDVYSEYGDITYAEKYPRYKNVLVLNKMNNELLYWDDLYNVNGIDENEPQGAYVSINKPFVIRNCATEYDTDINGPKPVDYTVDKSYSEAYVGKNQFWLHKPVINNDNQDQDHAGKLKYYDPEENKWLTVRAKADQIYIVSEVAPGEEGFGLFWIQESTNALYYSVRGQNGTIIWKPIESIWGSNPSQS